MSWKKTSYVKIPSSKFSDVSGQFVAKKKFTNLETPEIPEDPRTEIPTFGMMPCDMVTPIHPPMYL